MKNIIIILTVSITIFGCKKQSPNTYTIKGQLLNCNNGVTTPTFVNTSIDLFQQNGGSNNNSKVLANTTTDAQGNFTFSYTTTNTFDKLIIRSSSGFGFLKIIEDIPLEDLTNLKVILPAYNLVVGLNVIKPYTTNDTLYATRPDSNLIFRIVGPFVSGRLFRCKNVLLNKTLSFKTNEQKLSSGVYSGLFGLDLSKNYLIENSKLCGDTVYVNIDVR